MTTDSANRSFLSLAAPFKDVIHSKKYNDKYRYTQNIFDIACIKKCIKTRKTTELKNTCPYKACRCICAKGSYVQYNL